MATMLLGGLWHGAGWTFVIWGGLHGLYLMINHGWRELKAHLGWREGGSFAKVIAGAITFFAVAVAWVFFRADTLSAALAMLSGMFGANGIMPAKWVPAREALKIIIPCLMLAWLFPNTRQMLVACKPVWEDMVGIKTPTQAQQNRLARWLKWQPTRIHAIVMAVLFMFCIDRLSRVSEFLYFRF